MKENFQSTLEFFFFENIVLLLFFGKNALLVPTF